VSRVKGMPLTTTNKE